MPPYSTLQEVQDWLKTLSVGEQVSVGSTLFSPPLIQQIFTLLPDANPIALTITAIDVPNATLTGTATVLGEAEATAVFVFTQADIPGGTLLAQLTLTPSATLAWTLLPAFQCTFGQLSARLAPDASASFIELSFSAALQAGSGADRMSVPIALSVPSVPGDWTIRAALPSPITTLSKSALQAFAGNNDVTQLIPSAISFEHFTLDDFEMAFNPAAATCTMIRVSLGYTTDWTFFDSMFTVESLHFAFEAIQPFATSPSFHGTVDAEMAIPQGGETKFDVGAQFVFDTSGTGPDYAVFAQLAPDSALNLTSVLEFFHVPLPANFPDVEISTLSFIFFPENKSFDFKIGISKPIPIIGSVALDTFNFEIGATWDGANVAGTGALYAAFSLGSGPTETTLTLAGHYSSDGLTLMGAVANLQVGDLIDMLAAKFGIDPSSIPAPISQIELKSAKVTLATSANSGTDSFTFLLDATTTVADVGVDFLPVIALTYDSTRKQFSGSFSGTLILTVSQTETLTFTVTFNDSPADTAFTASYQDTGGTGLTFETIAAVFGFSLEGVPPSLDLDLTGAGFTYDTQSGVLAFGVQSKTYGNAAFVSLLLGGVRQQFFLLDANQSFSLSNLPLVGSALAKIENIQIEQLAVIVSTKSSGQDDAGKINDAIGTLKPPPVGAYPRIPADGVTGTVLLSAQLDFGSETLPLSLALGGSGGTRALPAPPPGSPQPGALPVSSGAVSSGASDGVTWYTIQKSFGPVSLQRIGAMYQSQTQTLWFEIDGTLQFGPLALSLVGLGIGSPITTFKPQFSLAGLGLSYSEPPLDIAGAFVNLLAPGDPHVAFAGGLTIGTGEFTLEVFGYYGDTTGFSSMFIFGDLAYPFGGPPAFFVTGVALGFGYNSNLVIPTIDQIESFPFVEVLPTSTVPNPGLFGPNPTPLTVLQTILNPTPPQTAWVTPQAGSLWFAAGITFTSFELVNSQALIIVELGNELVIALVGTARAQFPQVVDTAGPVYAYIELDLLVRFAPSEGVFSLQAMLAKSSFLLDQACVLTGGFAFFVWFGANAHAGDFVLTLGGYNAGFTPPPYYPAVPIVGFHWSLDSSITISGGVYFALTPAVLMVGGRLDATYQSGNLKAWFDAHADVIVRWKPFWIDANIGLTVGASYKINLVFTTATITVELGCNLQLWGPPTGGTVSVEWYIISFTIPFGTAKSSAPQISGWTDVQAMLPNTGTATAPNVLTLSPVSGLTTTKTSPSNGQGRAPGDTPPAPWIVRGSQFAFSTSTSIPVTTATVGGSYAFNGSTFNVHPLQWTNVSTTHVITITDQDNTDYSSAFQAAQVQNGVPASLWGAPPEGSNGAQVPSGANQVVPNQIVGVSLTVNAPQIGASAGSIDVLANLSAIDLALPGADLPLSNAATPVGDVPVNSQTTVATIADPDTGIASTANITIRDEIFLGLASIGYAPDSSNDPMTTFAHAAGCAFAAEPLVVA